MRKKDEAEIQRAAITKVARTLIRLKHSLQADREINEAIPDAIQRFDTALAAGELLELTDVMSILDGDDAEASK